MQPVLEAVRPEETLEPSDNFGLHSVLLHEKSKFAGSTIRGCGLREAINGLIVGIEREGKRVLNPDSSFVLLPGDLVWLVGENEKIKTLA